MSRHRVCRDSPVLGQLHFDAVNSATQSGVIHNLRRLHVRCINVNSTRYLFRLSSSMRHIESRIRRQNKPVPVGLSDGMTAYVVDGLSQVHQLLMIRAIYGRSCTSSRRWSIRRSLSSSIATTSKRGTSTVDLMSSE